MNDDNKMADKNELVSATQEREPARQASTGKSSTWKRSAKTKPKESDPGSCFKREEASFTVTSVTGGVTLNALEYLLKS